MKSVKAEKIEVLKPTTALMTSRKGNMMVTIVTIGALIGAVGGGVFLAEKFGLIDKAEEQAASVVKKTTTVDGQTKEVVVDPDSAQMCGDGMTTEYDAIAVNPLDDDGTPTYPEVSLRIWKEDGSGAMRSYTTDTDGTFASSSLTLSCPQDYMAYVPAETNTTASAKFPISADQAVKDDQLEVENVDFIQMKAYDNLNKAYVYDSADADNSDYEDFADGTVTFKSTTDNSTATTLGTAGELDWTFRIKTDSQKAWGDLNNYLVVDADSTDYEEPSVYFGGKLLEDIGKAGLPHEDDQGVVSAYEYVYKLPADVTDRASELRIVVNGKSGINPDADIKGRFLAESISIDGTQPRMSIFTNDGTEVLMGSAQTFTLDIA